MTHIDESDKGLTVYEPFDIFRNARGQQWHRHLRRVSYVWRDDAIWKRPQRM